MMSFQPWSDALRALMHNTARAADGLASDLLGDELPPVARVLREADFQPDSGHWCRRCGMSVGPGEATANGCGSCRDRRPGFECVVRLGEYEDPLRSWILMIKYLRWESMGRQLGRMLGAQIRREEGAGVELVRGSVVVPMAMPWLRRLDRGIDHASVIGAGVSTELGVPMHRVLRRSARPLQVGRPRAERRRLGGKGIRFRKGGEGVVRGRRVILVDDVLTTGSTMRRAAWHVRRAGATGVVGAVVSVAREPGRGGGEGAQGLRGGCGVGGW